MKRSHNRTANSNRTEEPENTRVARHLSASPPPDYDSVCNNWLVEPYTQRAPTQRTGKGAAIPSLPRRVHSPSKPLPSLPEPPLHSLRSLAPSSSNMLAESTSGWLDDSDSSGDESGAVESTWRTEMLTPTWRTDTQTTAWRTNSRASERSNETVVPRSPSAPPPKSRSTVIRITGTEDDLPPRRPPVVPYEVRPSERALEAKKHDQWRQKVMNVLCL
ncbi:hypothetical protein C8R45DRAFT_156314 [Mycena sanguinolenta]|nr:hypothetical protein C8R45DRAFT_156314 [Mycena sanguinolenta]